MAEAALNSPTGLGDMIDRLAEIRDEKRGLNNQLKELDEQFKDLQEAIMQALDAQGMQFGGSSRYRATITESVVPTVEDWQGVEEFVKQEDALFLFERRIAVAAWREFHESGTLVPGTSPFTKRGLSLTKAKR